MLLRQFRLLGKSSRAVTNTRFSASHYRCCRIISRVAVAVPGSKSDVQSVPTRSLLRTMSTTAVRSSPAVSTALSLDHIVLTVKDLDATVRFYEDVLGMKHSSFTSPSSPDVHRHALTFGPQKINLHVSGKEFEPKAERVTPGSADLCFLVEESVDEVVKRLSERGVHVLEGGGVVERTGARGKLRSVYVRDPDGNLIE
jgi:catechol 2,3-dioxygenase-like lactoylglutathione lyase family enzyme